MDFQKTILEIRTKNGLTQDEFAEKLHVTRQAVSRWENGETTPAIETLKAIAEVFKVDANVLLGTTSQVCQSCSMHLTDIADLGSNADDGVSLEYCVHCYKNGKFVGYASLEEAIADSVNYAEVAGMTKEAMLEYAKATLPTLKRWKTN